LSVTGPVVTVGCNGYVCGDPRLGWRSSDAGRSGDGAWARLSARGGGRRAPWFAALLLGICLAPAAFSATAADASLGELSFLGCIGQLSGCSSVPTEFAGAVERPHGFAVSPDGTNVYAADASANAIDVFSRNTVTGMLTFTGCVGQHSGCAHTTPANAVEEPFAVAVSPDGKNVYAVSAAFVASSVLEFSRNVSTGALTYTGCFGQVAGCVSTIPKEAVSGPQSVAISADGTSVYVASEDAGGAVDEFSRDTSTGALKFEGCSGDVGGCKLPPEPEAMRQVTAVVISPGGANVYVGGQGASISTYSRNVSTGALTFQRCIGNSNVCEQVHPMAVNEPTSLSMSPDGANLYAGNSANGAVDVFSRNTSTGVLTFSGCNGALVGEPGACSEMPAGNPEGPLAVAASPDGADVYVVGENAVYEYARGPAGALTFAACTGDIPGVCTPTVPEEALSFSVSLALSPNGASLYVGAEVAKVIDVFGRMTPPPASPPVTVGEPVGTPSGQSSSSTATTATTVGVASTPKAVEELLLGCSGSKLVLNDVYIQGGRVKIRGSAAKSLVGKKVKILFNEGKQVATATVETGGQYTTTAPLPPAKIRDNLDTRYTAEIGKLRSLHLKLVRRLLLEPPKASGTTVMLTGRLTLPLTKPIAPVLVEQQLECGKTTIVKTFTPPASGRFHITLTVPANARAGIFRLTSKIAANEHSVKHGFTTFSLPLPVALG
jgi:DNA-binding beta-propeller fold protein YncE